MWLDRFSVNSTPSGTPPPFGNRAYSPSPRRPSRLSPAPPNSRPGYGPRNSSALSLTLISNDSNTSLPGTARSNGVNVKTGAFRERPTDVQDPLEVLNGILGKQPSDKPAIVEPSKPTHLIKDVDFDGLSLEDYVTTGNATARMMNTKAGVETIQHFEGERDKFQELHNAISGCDDVLKSVESYLSDFQTELGVVSAEIETLQERSIQLNDKLENRRNVEKLLGPAVEEISISPRTVRTISEGPIDENWVKALNEIDAREVSIGAKAASSTTIKAIEDVKPLLTDLKNKAIERIRDYLVAQVKAMRSPNINAQIIQQQNLVKFKDLYSFISRAHPTLADEITQAYVNTMRWYYLSNFTRYQQALEKLKIHAPDRNELLGSDPTTQRVGNLAPNGRTGSVTYDPYALGRRIDILKSNNHMAVSSYAAEEDKSAHGFEILFRNFNLALVDNVSAEFSFLTEMFAVKTYQQVSRKATEIFEPVFTLGQSITKQFLENTSDSLGVLICVRLNQQAAFELQRRKVPVADSYINGTNMQLWPRFQMIMDLHCESLKKVAANLSSSRSTVTALSLSGGDDAAKQSAAPHFLTQRFGQLLHGILTLSNEAGDDEPVSNSLLRLTTEFDALLTKLSRSHGDPKRRERFLFNNYSLILTIISDTEGKLASEQKAHFEEKLKESSRR